MTRDEDCYSVEFSIEEEVEHEGEGCGLTFSLIVSKPGGEVCHALQPGNYTPEAWCHTAEEVEARFQALASPTIAGMIADTIEKWED